MKKHKRALALVLALVMALALLPASALAALEDRKPSEVFAYLPANPAPVTPPTYEESGLGSSYVGTDWPEEYKNMGSKGVYAEIASLVNSLIKGKTSETAKAKAIYQWVANNISYMYEGDDGAVGTYATRKAICWGYTRLSSLMQRLAGLPTADILSVPDDHAWSAVYADGRWIMYDSTFKQWDFAPDAGLSLKKHISQMSYVDGSGPWSLTIFNEYEEIIDIEPYYMGGDNSSPEQVVVPEGVTLIRRANIPKSVTSIILPSTLRDFWGFREYENLASISIPEGVTGIGDLAFAKCTNLTSVVIAGATEIGSYAFNQCENLKSVTLPDSLKKLGSYTFKDCKSLSSVEIPAGVTEIGNNVFIGCTSLTSVTLPAGLTKIGAGTFYGCSSLKDVWFCGTKEQWDAIEEIDSKSNDALKKATVHYNSVHSTGTAYASNITVDVDGKPVQFQCYALHDANGNPTNYIKLRDLADILNGTAAQFEVGFDGSALITTKRAYTPNGSEHSTPFSGNRTYRLADNSTKIDGMATDLAAFMLYDDNGGGYTYYQLRDLGEKLGFNVGWSGDRGAFVETGKPYNPND